MKNIVLVGFMGSGKTTVGRQLAKALDREFVDLDDEIEAQEKMRIADIFREKGEPYFRKAEQAAVNRFSIPGPRVIACGGGVVINPDNVQALKKNGTLICLFARPEIILERTKNYAHRPLLNVPDPKARIEQLLAERERYYQQADYRIDTSGLSISTVVEKILDLVKE